MTEDPTGNIEDKVKRLEQLEQDFRNNSRQPYFHYNRVRREFVMLCDELKESGYEISQDIQDRYKLLKYGPLYKDR
ncbi:hypothetical protein HYX18_03890 [Candidatus Woesearchaeota archaeon]|nr:hypothetical protein [Candidatus Woesearchaeota archaeon]